MPRLIEELKADHISLKHTLRKAADHHRPASERIRILIRAKAALIAHLEKENRELYPTLRAAVESDPHLSGVVDVFARDMEQIAPQALDFFEKYGDAEAVAASFTSNVQNVIEFGAELERLIILLGLRIGREENTLYPAFELVNPRKAACSSVG